MRKVGMVSRCALLGAIVSTVILGCVEQTSYKTSDGSEKVAKYLLSEPPKKMDRKIDAELDGKVVLLGYDFSPKKVAPGEKVMVTWYWKCVEAPGAGWKIFTHLVDGSGSSRINKDRAGPIRKHYQPEHWKTGSIIEDPQQITVPKKWGSSTINLRIGLWKNDSRMSIRKGPSDKENRVKGPTIRVMVDEKKERHVIPRAAVAPTIDGAFDAEEAWKGALKLSDFTNTIDGEPVSFRTQARVMWDDQFIYIAANTEDSYLQSKYTKHDDELWHEDAFEVFLDPGADKKHYYEIQVNPAGIVFDSYLPRYRKNTNEWSSDAKVAATIDGTLNDSEGRDKSWSVEMAIPFASLDKGGSTPPGKKDVWAVNFFSVDATEKRPRYSAWFPPLRGDFHALDRFGHMIFEQPPTPVAPVAPSDGGPVEKVKDLPEENDSPAVAAPRSSRTTSK